MVNISIEITDDGTECTDYYMMEYKLPSDAFYTEAPRQYASPVEIANLQSDTLYNIKVTRFCCNGQFSTPLTFDRTTTVLTAPTGFTATPGNTEVVLNWDDMAGADNYVLEMATLSDFTGATVIDEGTVSGYTKTGLSNGTQYYFRVKQQQTGFPDSDWSTDSATPTP